VIRTSRTLIWLAIVSMASLAAHAKAGRHSPWHAYVVCENDWLLKDASVWERELLVPDTGTRWKCKVTALKASSWGSTSRDLVCGTDSGLSVSDGIDTGAGSKHRAHLSIRDNGRGCDLQLLFGDTD
jgi:hypothetical protein